MDSHFSLTEWEPDNNSRKVMTNKVDVMPCADNDHRMCLRDVHNFLKFKISPHMGQLTHTTVYATV